MESQLTSIAHNNDELDCIRNGMIVEGNGHRAVAFSVNPKTMEIKIRNMISQKNTEKHYGWNAGVQSIRNDDYVALSSWSAKSKRIQVYRKTSKGLVPTRNYGGSYNSRLIAKLPESIIKFLEPRGGGPSFLPTGPWRINYDMFKTLPREQIERFLIISKMHPDWIEYLTNEALKVPEQHLITDWNSKHVKSLPKTLQAHEEYWTKTKESDSEVYVYNSMVWLLLFKDGSSRIIEPDPTSGHHYVGPSRRIIETFKSLPRTMPKDVVRAIQFNIGAYEKDERSYGVRWYLYKN